MKISTNEGYKTAEKASGKFCIFYVPKLLLEYQNVKCEFLVTASALFRAKISFIRGRRRH
jgi:hypothetical protein